MSVYLRMLGLGLCLPLLGPAGAAQAGGKKRRALPPQAILSGTLNEKRDDIQRCAIVHALNQGADKVEVLTKVTINSRGQVVNSQVQVTVQGSDGEMVKSCVDQVVRSIKFPQIDAPLIHIERSWTVSAAQ